MFLLATVTLLDRSITSEVNDALPARASDGERRLFSGSDAAIIDDIRALRDLDVRAIDFDFEQPAAATIIAGMRSFRERVLAKV